MAQYDVFQNPGRDGLLVDCQSDLLGITDTRFAIPLIPEDDAPRRIAILNPVIEIGGRPYVLATQLATAIRVKPLGEPIASLAARHYEIVRALDVLLTGV